MIEKISQISPGVSLFSMIWVQNKNDRVHILSLDRVHILSLGDSVCDCERYEMVSESSSYPEIHGEFRSL